jgi:hypothetical protein
MQVNENMLYLSVLDWYFMWILYHERFVHICAHEEFMEWFCKL